jgi:hypothetical protein
MANLAEAYNVTQNALGYKSLSDEVKLIQGDGINMDTYEKLLEALHKNKWSVTNLVVGSGGGLLQKVNRDTLRCAIKASFTKVEGQERSIRKDEGDGGQDVQAVVGRRWSARVLGCINIFVCVQLIETERRVAKAPLSAKVQPVSQRDRAAGAPC